MENDGRIGDADRALVNQAQGPGPSGFDPSRAVVQRMAQKLCCINTCEAAGAPYDPARGQVAICMSHTYEHEARAALSVVSHWLGARAIRYDHEADAAKDATKKMQGAALASAANELSGLMRLPSDSDTHPTGHDAKQGVVHGQRGPLGIARTIAE